ncbi:type II toxin-antitoxin system VapC family toxin [Treponema sp.]|uniref:type II toxin-antitoxin system VapC family toxin n=1 Tax=Treponema sp. TaxID=166 RepID=UPI003F096F58
MNKVYLLDTNIVSEFSKECPDQNVISLYEQRKDLCAISAVTWQELEYGVSKMPDGKRKSYIEKCLANYKECLPVIAYDGFAADICGKLLGTNYAKGKPLPLSDTQIAATAIANGMVLVTHNVSDFAVAKEKSFLKVEDWFSNEE